MAEVLGSGCYLSAVDAYTLSTLPDPQQGRGGYGSSGAAPGCVNVGVSKGTGQYVMGGDRLVLTAWGSVGGVAVTLAGQQVTPDCQVTPFVLTLTPDDQVTPATQTLTLAEGMITALSCKVADVTVQRGQIYVRAEVGIFTAGALAPYGTLIADYVWGSFQPTFPPAQPRGPREGPGFVRFLFQDMPSPASDWFFTQERTRVWRAISGSFGLQTDATAGNRRVTVTQGSLVQALWVASADKVQPASSLFAYYFSRGNRPATLVATEALICIPETPQGESTGADQLFGVIAGTVGAADQFLNIYALVEEWLNI